MEALPVVACIWCANMPQSGLNFEQIVQNSMTLKWPHTFIITHLMNEEKKKLTNFNDQKLHMPHWRL